MYQNVGNQPNQSSTFNSNIQTSNINSNTFNNSMQSQRQKSNNLGAFVAPPPSVVTSTNTNSTAYTLSTNTNTNTTGTTLTVAGPQLYPHLRGGGMVLGGGGMGMMGMMNGGFEAGGAIPTMMGMGSMNINHNNNGLLGLHAAGNFPMGGGMMKQPGGGGPPTMMGGGGQQPLVSGFPPNGHGNGGANAANRRNAPTPQPQQPAPMPRNPFSPNSLPGSHQNQNSNPNAGPSSAASRSDSASQLHQQPRQQSKYSTNATDDPSQMNFQNLFVTKIPRDVSDGILMTIFKPFGATSAKVMVDAASGYSKGFGFVVFPSEEMGRWVYDQFNKKPIAVSEEAILSALPADRPPRQLYEFTMFPSHHDSGSAAKESTSLYIRNVPRSWDVTKVVELLRLYGDPIYYAMRDDRLGNPVWVVYVEYDCIVCSRNALKHIHGLRPAVGQPPILAKYADNAEVRKFRRDKRMGSNANGGGSGAAGNGSSAANEEFDGGHEGVLTTKEGTSRHHGVLTAPPAPPQQQPSATEAGLNSGDNGVYSPPVTQPLANGAIEEKNAKSDDNSADPSASIKPASGTDESAPQVHQATKKEAAANPTGAKKEHPVPLSHFYDRHVAFDAQGNPLPHILQEAATVRVEAAMASGGLAPPPPAHPMLPQHSQQGAPLTVAVGSHVLPTAGVGPPASNGSGAPIMMHNTTTTTPVPPSHEKAGGMPPPPAYGSTQQSLVLQYGGQFSNTNASSPQNNGLLHSPAMDDCARSTTHSHVSLSSNGNFGNGSVYGGSLNGSQASGGGNTTIASFLSSTANNMHPSFRGSVVPSAMPTSTDGYVVNQNNNASLMMNGGAQANLSLMVQQMRAAGGGGGGGGGSVGPSPMMGLAQMHHQQQQQPFFPQQPNQFMSNTVNSAGGRGQGGGGGKNAQGGPQQYVSGPVGNAAMMGLGGTHPMMVGGGGLGMLGAGSTVASNNGVVMGGAGPFASGGIAPYNGGGGMAYIVTTGGNMTTSSSLPHSDVFTFSHEYGNFSSHNSGNPTAAGGGSGSHLTGTIHGNSHGSSNGSDAGGSAAGSHNNYNTHW